jgi:hypothetical protein
MANTEQVEKIKCPHCGWIRSINLDATLDESMASVVMGENVLQGIARRIKAAQADARLDAANAWIDMPACPHCKNTYRYNVRTGEVAK